MRSPRYVLFRPTSADIGAAHVFRALALIPNTSVLPIPEGHLVFDRGSEHCVRVTLAAGPLVAGDARALANEHPGEDLDGRARVASTTARFELHYAEDDAVRATVLFVQGALERLTGGFGYDLACRAITIARSVGLVEIERAMEEEARAATAKLCGERLGARIEEQLDVYEALVGALGRRELPVMREGRRALIAKVAAARREATVGRAVSRVLRERPLPTLKNAELQALVDEMAKRMGERSN